MRTLPIIFILMVFAKSYSTTFIVPGNISSLQGAISIAMEGDTIKCDSIPDNIHIKIENKKLLFVIGSRPDSPFVKMRVGLSVNTSDTKILNLDIQGIYGINAQTSISTPGGIGLEATNSSISIANCKIIGGKGGNGYSYLGYNSMTGQMMSICNNPSSGGNGLVAVSCSLKIQSVSIHGGDAGNYQINPMACATPLSVKSGIAARFLIGTYAETLNITLDTLQKDPTIVINKLTSPIFPTIHANDIQKNGRYQILFNDVYDILGRKLFLSKSNANKTPIIKIYRQSKKATKAIAKQ